MACIATVVGMTVGTFPMSAARTGGVSTTRGRTTRRPRRISLCHKGASSIDLPNRPARTARCRKFLYRPLDGWTDPGKGRPECGLFVSCEALQHRHDALQLQLISHTQGVHTVSVTFFIPQAPTEMTFPYQDEPEYSVRAPVAPFFELNLSNSNAADILSAIFPTVDYSYDLSGTWAGGSLDTAIKNTTKLLNGPTKKSLVKEDEVSQNFVSFGRTKEYVDRRLSELLQLMVLARSNGFTVAFG